MGDQKETNGLQTRGRIIRSFARLMETKRWDQIGVCHLCREAGISRGTFYLYFHSLYDLMEQLQKELLDQLKTYYVDAGKSAASVSLYPPEMFDEIFDCHPPGVFIAWFEFCSEYGYVIAPLLDRKHGDPYFVKKMKHLIREELSRMMDRDGMPRDGLRRQFISLLAEMHMVAAQNWLDEPGECRSEQIVNLLNTMRVGANYLSNRQRLEREKNSRTYL